MTAQHKVSVKMVHAALDDESGEIILRGVIEPSSLADLKCADYQREILPLSRISELAKAYKTGAVPDIDLGMRGGNYTEKDSAFYLHDEVFIIDGLQRKTAALEAMKAGTIPRLGATVHFNTTEDWERKRFRMLNSTQLRLSPNVLMRNLRKENQFVEMFYALCLDKNFALYNRVSWDQRMRREHLITAISVLKAIGVLHSHLSTGLSNTSHEGICISFERLMKKIGRTTVRKNITAFWQMMDECWSIRTVHFKESAVFLHGTFVQALANVLNRHKNFWKDSELVVPRDLQRKIQMFPINDNEVVRLSGAGGRAKDILFQLIVEHINSGKRTKHLVPFDSPKVVEEVVEVKETVGGYIS